MYKQGTDGSSRKWKQFVVMGEVRFGDSTLAESENVFYIFLQPLDSLIRS